MLLRAQEDLYEVGARNFLFIDVPPIDRSPAGEQNQILFCKRIQWQIPISNSSTVREPGRR